MHVDLFFEEKKYVLPHAHINPVVKCAQTKAYMLLLVHVHYTF